MSPTATEIRRDAFVQEGPHLAHPYLTDPLLQSALRRLLPPEVHREVEPELVRFGERATRDLRQMGDDAEAHPPLHLPFDPWGRRVDHLEVSDGWRRLKRVAAEEGLVAMGYERRWGAASRLVQHAFLLLFHPSTATYLCPLAMTDGAARLVELLGDQELRLRALPRLTSRDPDRFWTSGQWMTEKAGGSDVSRTETVAVRDPAGGWRLSGVKWFTSAVDSDVAFTLARPEGASEGSRSLSLYFVELRDEEGRLQGIRVERLKDKLGTRALPTAELTLEGTPARLVGNEGDGVRKIAHLMNVTRVYNSSAAVSTMQRALALARDYSRRRQAFGRPLAEQPLHLETLAGMATEVAAGLVLLLRVVELQGREEAGEAAGDEARILRLLVPLVKLYSGKQAVAVASEALECFGGAGYVEDTGLPRLLRDAQVLPIWEGTTNVLALDALRAIRREEALAPLLADLERLLEAVVGEEALATGLGRARVAVAALRRDTAELLDRPTEALEARGRRLAYGLARTAAATLLLNQAGWARRTRDAAAPLWTAAARRWCRRELVPELAPPAEGVEGARRLAMAEAGEDGP